MADDSVVPGVQPLDFKVDLQLIKVSQARQEGKVQGLTLALKYARAAKRGRSGQLELVGYLESQLRLAEEVPF